MDPIFNLRVTDIRLLFDTRDVAVTFAIPMELLEDAQNEQAALSLVSKLITMVPYLRDHVLEWKKVHEQIRGTKNLSS